jgi:hypothetical protein
MLLVGTLKRKQHLILSSFNDIMKLPITEKELDFIMEIVKYKNKNLYDKLWSYKFNYLLQKQK